MKDIIQQVLSFLLLIITLWFTFTIVNIIVTIYRTKKADKSLAFCFNSLGKIFYGILTAVYLIGFIGGVSAMIYGLVKHADQTFFIGLQVVAFITVVFAFFLSSIVMVGRKYMMVGRMMIDYRKLKKVNYTHNNKMSFVYAQHDYNFSTRFVDKTKLRKLISK